MQGVHSSETTILKKGLADKYQFFSNWFIYKITLKWFNNNLVLISEEKGIKNFGEILPCSTT